MPIDNGFSSRRTLVQKFNPNHGKDGRFASAPGGRRGGTVGAPTSDAFGNPLKGYKKGPFKAGTYGATQRNLDAGKQTAAAHSQRAQYVASHVHGVSDKGYSHGNTRDPNFYREPEAGTGPGPVKMPNIEGNPGPSKMPNVDTPEAPRKLYSPMLKGPVLYDSGTKSFVSPKAGEYGFLKPAMAKRFAVDHPGVGAPKPGVSYQHPGSMDKAGKPKKRSSFS